MVFERVLVGFDGSPESERALAAGLALRAAEGALRAVTVADLQYASRAGMDAPALDQLLREQAGEHRDTAAALLESTERAEAIVVTGPATRVLLAQADDFAADLIAVGSHGGGRLAGVLLGSVATGLVHGAPCSVLVARGSQPLDSRPRSVVVGVDTSPPSLEAAAIAERIASASGAALRRVTATGGKGLPDDVSLPAEVDTRAPVEALVDASRSADLVVVGSRGIHGLAALGSVAERVAHQAECPVLIVRAR